MSENSSRDRPLAVALVLSHSTLFNIHGFFEKLRLPHTIGPPFNRLVRFQQRNIFNSTSTWTDFDVVLPLVHTYIHSLRCGPASSATEQPSCKSFITFTLTKTYNLTKYLDVWGTHTSPQHREPVGHGVLTIIMAFPFEFIFLFKVRTRMATGQRRVQQMKVKHRLGRLKSINSWLPLDLCTAAHEHTSTTSMGHFQWMTAASEV